MVRMISLSILLVVAILLIQSLQCSKPTTHFPTLARLVSPNDKVGQPFGRVEVYHNGEWGTVCSDVWTKNNAQVICRMIGFRHGHAIEVADGLLGEGQGKILLSGLQCKGDETNLDKCMHAWNSNSCDHSQDAGVFCTEQMMSEADRKQRKDVEIKNRVTCSNHGKLKCACDNGYAGESCEDEVDYCAMIINDFQDGPIPAGQLCQPHGYCISTATGAVCECEYGYKGEFCHTVVKERLYQSIRCALYPTNAVTKANVSIGCPGTEKCIPDHLYCDVTNKCTKPFGWCLPEADYERYLKYVDKTFDD